MATATASHIASVPRIHLSSKHTCVRHLICFPELGHCSPPPTLPLSTDTSYHEDIYRPLAICSTYVRSLMFAVAYLRMVMQRRIVDRHRTTVNVPVSHSDGL